MRSVVPWLLVLLLLPRVEDPWPNTIGLEFLATTAGIGALLAGLAFAAADARTRERAVLWGTAIGFGLGGAFYLVSLAAQLLSNS